MDGHGGSTVCYTNSFTLYMCRFYTSQQTGWVRWCGWRAQRDAVIRSTVRRHWFDATIVWTFSYTDGNIPRCHQLIFHLSLLHTWCRKRRNEHKYKTRAPTVQLPPKGEGYTETLFHEVFIPTCWCQPVFLTVSWHQPVVASLWRCKRHVEKIKSLLHSSLRALSYDMIYDVLLDMVSPQLVLLLVSTITQNLKIIWWTRDC